MGGGRIRDLYSHSDSAKWQLHDDLAAISEPRFSH